MLRKLFNHVNAFGIHKGFVPHVVGTLQYAFSCLLLYLVLLCDGCTFNKGIIGGGYGSLQHVYLVSHCDHRLDKSGTIRTKVFEEFVEGEHVAAAVHLFEDHDECVHSSPGLKELFECSACYAKVVLNGGCSFAHLCYEFCKGCGSHLGFKSHTVYGCTKGKNIGSSECSLLTHREQAVGEVYNFA